MHQRFCMLESIMYLFSFLLNMLPLRFFASLSTAIFWVYLWRIICSKLHELDQLLHYVPLPTQGPSGQILVEWRSPFL